ncbi:CD99 molecule isoform X1 [Puntigrus tetrazona]|uniref:CD99 molecule isoform X1 n=1 Tax=Puntigrus tetrazona TaxID=1606681 RepID=UPI001C89316A|nr:CD99 molecule isoform X1 [Puntigrus tetrazona]XP_043091349.1 CD99 molecule isoform X1 [Puntigrus tetrazona]
MTSHAWILLLLASLVATRAQDLDLSDAFDDDEPPAKPTVKPAPPKKPDSGFDLSDAFDSDPKKPPVAPPKSEDDKKKPSGGDFDLSDAFGPDIEPKKPVVPPKERGTGGGTFDDTDLSDVNEGGEYKPDGGRSGGRGGDVPQYNDNGGASDQPQGGAMAAIISSVGVALLGAASSYFAYQKKKLCFKIQGGEDPEIGKNPGTQSDPQVLSNLLRSSGH